MDPRIVEEVTGLESKGNKPLQRDELNEGHSQDAHWWRTWPNNVAMIMQGGTLKYSLYFLFLLNFERGCYVLLL